MERRKINYIKEKRAAVDNCNICGKVAALTWDHVPPKSITNGICVNANRLFEGVPEDNRCAAIYKNGVKFRSVCAECNNKLLGTNDKYYMKFADDIANVINQGSLEHQYIDVNISKVIKSVLGHFLAAKNSYDDKCIIDKSIREYLLGKNSRPNCKLYYWIYPYNTINIVRDVALINMNGSVVPSGTISVIACSPVGFILTDYDGEMPGLVNLISLLTNNDEACIRLKLDVSSAFYPNSNIIRHYSWPCNIGDDQYSVSAVLVGEYGFEDSRFATRRRK